jgi:hypothetical protein
MPHKKKPASGGGKMRSSDLQGTRSAAETPVDAAFAELMHSVEMPLVDPNDGREIQREIQRVLAEIAEQDEDFRTLFKGAGGGGRVRVRNKL